MRKVVGGPVGEKRVRHEQDMHGITACPRQTAARRHCQVQTENYNSERRLILGKSRRQCRHCVGEGKRDRLLQVPE